MPDALTKIHDQSRFDQVVAWFKESHSTVRLIDARPRLMEARKSDRVFQKTDTHWNDLGAYVGYRIILDAVKDSVPGKRVVPRFPGEFERKTTITVGGDLAYLMNLQDVFREERISLIGRVAIPPLPDPIPDPYVWNVDDPRLPRVVMLRDSFATAMLPMLYPHFSHGVYRWNDVFDIALVEREKPDLVIVEMVERGLDSPLSIDPPEVQNEK
jgi:hypothetical protein